LSKEPEISIISACYNHGAYIGEMIESVMNQTFSNFEVIIVNDGSTDNTAQILNSIRNEKVKIIHTENRGPASARNTAIKNASAPIIMNLDADDRIAPVLLEKAYSILETNPGVGIVYTEVEFFGEKTGRFEIQDYTPESMLLDNRIVSNAFFRRDDWLATGGYSDELIYGLEDWDFWLQIIELGRDVVKINEPLVYYRTYPDPKTYRSGRRKSDRMKQLESLVIIFKRHRKLYSQFPEAWEHFSELENKLLHENKFVRYIKNNLFVFMQKYYWR
jgi:glycosyltransferase involved in cell wall biosynthesis